MAKTTEGMCTVEVEKRQVAVRAWRYVFRGVHGARVPVLLLDKATAHPTAA
jgi:hypothetical protein